MKKFLCAMCTAALILPAQSPRRRPMTKNLPAVPKPAMSLNPTFSATLFSNLVYSPRGIDGKFANKFDFDRVYFTMKTPLAEDWKFQVTTDIYRNASATSYYNGLAVRLKFAIVEYTPFTSLSVKFGMVPGPWNGLVEIVLEVPRRRLHCQRQVRAHRDGRRRDIGVLHAPRQGRRRVGVHTQRNRLLPPRKPTGSRTMSPA